MLLRRAIPRFHGAGVAVSRSQQRCAHVERPQSSNSGSELSKIFTTTDNATTTYRPPDREAPRLTIDTHVDQVKAKLSQAAPLDASSDLHQTSDREPSNVLRFERASKNLTLTDFRRITPQGKHIEGWSIAEGDVMKVVADRHPWTLEQNNMYLLVFSSARSAAFYLSHATRLHTLARQAANGNSFFGEALTDVQQSVADVDEAVAAFTVMSPAQNITMQHLHFPLSRHDVDIIREGGLPAVRSARPKRRPWELRLVLDGPQVDQLEIRQAMRNAASARGFPWSGDHRHHLGISRYEPRREADDRQHRTDYRQERPVYIISFDTQYAAENFLHFWHRRRLADHGDRTLCFAYNDPPIVELEALY